MITETSEDRKESKIQELENELALLKSQMSRLERKPTKKIGFLLLALGFASLALSYLISSEIVTLIGLGLVVWGAIFTVLIQTDLVREEVASLLFISGIRPISHFLEEMGAEGPAVYLPPEALEEISSARMKLHGRNNVSKLDNQNNDIYLVPLGLELALYFESKIGTSLLGREFGFLQQKIPPILVHDLELFTHMSLSVKDNYVRSEMTGKVGVRICQRVREIPNLHKLIGCPICSSIAVSLARALGKTISIEESFIRANAIENLYAINKD